MMTESGPTNTPPDWENAATLIFPFEQVNVVSREDRIISVGDVEAQIRAWEPPATTQRVNAIRGLMDAASAIDGIPRPFGDSDFVAMLGGQIYDACTVVPGIPLNRHGEFVVGDHGIVNLPLHESADHGDMLVEAARVLARVHEATRDHAALAGMASSTAIELQRGVAARWQQARKRLGAHAESLPEVRRWLRCGNRVIPVAAERIQAASDVAGVDNVLIHGDLWPAYLHVDDPSRPTTLHGLTGWRHAAAGSPVLDLARLSVRVTGWSEATVESVLGAYSDHTALPPATRRLVPVVAAIGLLDQLGGVLEVAYLDDDVANHEAQPFIRGGIKVLLRSLERLTNVLVPPEPVQRRFYGGGPRPRRPESTGEGRRRSPATQTRGSRRSPRSSRRRTRREG